MLRIGTICADRGALRGSISALLSPIGSMCALALRGTAVARVPTLTIEALILGVLVTMALATLVTMAVLTVRAVLMNRGKACALTVLLFAIQLNVC